MNIKLSEFSENGIKAVAAEIPDFNIQQTFDCGQCFRWIRQNDGSYTGIVEDKVLNVSSSCGKIIFKNTDINEFKNFWYHYFDLDRDYGKIKNELRNDRIMEKAIEFGGGIRILRQDIWEVLISFIISANNRIPMIMKVIENLSKKYGRMIDIGRSDIFPDKYYTFPSPEKLAGAEVRDIEACKAGFRAERIKKTAGMILDKTIDIYGLNSMSSEEAKDYLKQLHGVGEKVADCVLLYSGTKYDIFPTDVWIKRIMEKLYFGREASIQEIHRFAQEKFGEHAGIAQQYLFHYARSNGLK